DNYFKVTGELNAQIEGLEREIVRLEGVNEDLQSKLVKDGETIQKYYKMVGELEREIDELRAASFRQQRTIEELEGVVTPLRIAGEELQMENKKLATQRDTLKWLAGLLLVAGFFFAGGGM
ncbi:hypothetical protein IBX65_09360, partial [Candidatus Aerophobetes bacterium]|nr:hypothetical protein [Candidatus Aerophobetes bacterium]